MREEIHYINTDDYEAPKVANSLFEGRENVVQMQYKEGMPEVTILVQAYNQIDKIKRCIESILRNTKGINYELLLVDNGSEDETLEYFKQVDYEPKKIIRITKNIGSAFPACVLHNLELAPYVVLIPGDLVLTPHWLKNMLICMKSDKRIGMVNAVSSNVSNLQQVDLLFKDYEEMEKKAEQFNQSDPTKWEERMRLITLGTLYRKEALYTVGFPISDIGFFHDFGDDDISYRIRRFGYKLILAGDTWIHHDHDFRNLESKDPVEFQKSLEIGRQNFMEKYHGVDAWDNNICSWIQSLRKAPVIHDKKEVNILGIDVGSGDILLELKNHLRRNNIFDVNLQAFTQDATYREDLYSICNGRVICDREDGIRLCYPEESYDYIILGKAFNSYNEPFVILQDVMKVLKRGGILFLILENTFNHMEVLNIFGEREQVRENIFYHISLEQLMSNVECYGQIIDIDMNGTQLSIEKQEKINKILKYIQMSDNKDMNLARLITKEFILTTQKY